MMQRVHGFTLIELMIVVAIIGILASLASAQYGLFVTRSKVVQALEFIGRHKGDLAEYYYMTDRFPASDTDYFNATDGIVTRVNWSAGRGAIEAWFGADAGPDLDGKILWLLPRTHAGSIGWECRGHDGSGGAGWLLEPRYLPASCRN